MHIIGIGGLIMMPKTVVNDYEAWLENWHHTRQRVITGNNPTGEGQRGTRKVIMGREVVV